MRPWSPHGQTFQGEPITGTVPVGLVVEGPQLTPVQAILAQAKYVSFCARARLSVVPNSQEHGRLPDGSPYQISVVGNTTKMKILTSNIDGELRRSGIGIVLSDLQGAPLPEHPKSYILTPVERKGTRESTGKWRVRKVDSFVGGKAIFTNKKGDRYITSVGGVRHENLPAYGYDFYGTNGRAYRFGAYTADSDVFANGVAIGDLRDPALPFWRRRSSGELWAMQAVIEYDTSVVPARSWVVLFGGPYRPLKDQPIGSLLHRLSIPAGYSPTITCSISAHPEGKELRMMLNSAHVPLGTALVVIDVHDDSLSFRSITNRDYGGEHTHSLELTPWDNDSPSWTYTRTEISQYEGYRIAGHFGFDTRGKPTRVDGWAAGTEVSDIEVHTQVRVGLDPHPVQGGYYPGTITTTLDKNVVENSGVSSVTVDGERIILPSKPDLYTTEINSVLGYDNHYNLISVDRTGTKTQSQWRQNGGFLIYDATTRMHVYFTREVNRFATAQIVTEPVYGEDGTIASWYTHDVPLLSDDSQAVYTTHSELVVSHKGIDVFVLDISDRPEATYTAIAAVDPLTGAICVNVLERDKFAQQILRSWIFVADDVSVKQLHEIMDVEESTNIMIKSDKLILSV